MKLAPDTTPIGPPERPKLGPGWYLTDGSRLFRVVSGFTTRWSPFAELEDCRTLEVELYSADELYGMGLRPVRTP